MHVILHPKARCWQQSTASPAVGAHRVGKRGGTWLTHTTHWLADLHRDAADDAPTVMHAREMLALPCFSHTLLREQGTWQIHALFLQFCIIILAGLHQKMLASAAYTRRK